VFATAKYGHLFSAADTGHLGLCSAAMAGCVLLASTAPSSYWRWREPASALLRVYFCTLQASSLTRIAALESADPWGRHGSGVLAHLVFLGQFVFATKVVGLLQWGLVSRVRLPLHITFQGAAVAATVASISSLCTCGAMQQAPARAWMHKLFAVLDWLALYAPFSAPAFSASNSAGECWAVVATAQIGLGFAVPTVVHAAWECADFVRFSQQTRGRFRDGWCTWLYQNVTDGPMGEGWVRRTKLVLASWSLFSVLWGILRVAAGSAAAAAAACSADG
jgi:hypothetical protein